MSNTEKKITLKSLQPITITCVETDEKKYSKLFDEFTEQNHYLKHRIPNSNILRYLVFDCSGEVLASLMFCKPAWNLQSRENYFSWSQDKKVKNLKYVLNNSRFIIKSDLKVKNLATWILGRIAKTVSNDYSKLYGNEIKVLETFIDETRHSASCYKAANWTRVGEFKVKSGQKQLIGKPLGVYLYITDKSIFN